MATKRDYYEVLGVSRDAGGEQIKRAFRERAVKYHPDNYQGDKAEAEAKFRELAEAYQVLSDPDRRKLYDRHGHDGVSGAQVGDFAGMGLADILRMFEEIFGIGLGLGDRDGAGRRGCDLETEVEVTLEEVADGADKKVEFDRPDFCGTCDGTGAKPGTSPRRCTTCQGRRVVEHLSIGFLRMVSTCSTCRGKGTVIATPCPDCRGTGRVRVERVLTVHVPPGVADGEALRIGGQGGPTDEGNRRGDLWCIVRVLPHPLLDRRGNDVICQVPVTYTQAALGATIEVPTLGGKEKVVVPAGSQHGDVLTLKGHALPDRRTGSRGNQLVQLQIEVPRKLSRKEKGLLRELAEAEDIEALPARKGFLGKLDEHPGRT